jgi:hypothetical protein
MSEITCTMQPSDAFRRQLGRMGVVDPREQANVSARLNDLVTVDTLANLLDEALCATTGGNGTLDLRAVAEYVCRKMKEHQK